MFISKTYSNFFRTITDYFKMNFFNGRMDNGEVIISTYEKAVQRFVDRKNNVGEKSTNKFPFLTFDFSYDVQPDRTTAFGGVLKNHYNFAGLESSKDWNPKIYQDENLYVSPVFNRYYGELEIIIWASSIYELIDFRTNIYQFFGGLDRILIPSFEGYFILPDTINLYRYENPYNGEDYVLNWDETDVDNYYIKMLGDNKQYMVYPYESRVHLKLTDVSDGSTKYGNPSKDSISEHRMSVYITWEAWMPVHMVLVAEQLPLQCDSFSFELTVGYEYSKISEILNKTTTIPKHRLITTFPFDSTSSVDHENIDLIFKEEYMYSISAADKEKIDNGEIFFIYLPYELENKYFINARTKFGNMLYGYNYELIGQSTIKLVGFNLKALEENDNIYFSIYQKEI